MNHEPELAEFKLSALTMRALVWGPPDGRLAVCVHGFPDSADSWREVAPLLAAKGFRVVAPYTRGYAPTTLAHDGAYHMGALMSDLIELHRCLGAPRDAVLIGHDWGAWTCNALAAAPESPFSEYVSMSLPPIAAFDTFAGFPLQWLKRSIRQCRNSWYIMFFHLPVHPHRTLGRVIPRLWRDWSPRGADVSTGVADALAALPTDAHRAAAVSYYRSILRPARSAPTYASLHNSRFAMPTRPMLLLHGDQDGALQLEYTEGILRSLPKGSQQRTITSAGHFVQAVNVAEAITDYLDARAKASS